VCITNSADIYLEQTENITSARKSFVCFVWKTGAQMVVIFVKPIKRASIVFV